jgi:glutamyl-tRNA reductase
MQRLLLLGLNHTTAPLEVREKLAFNAQQRLEALARFRERFADSEAVLVSTCNRVELYAAREVHGHPRVEEMIEFLAQCHGLDPQAFADHVYQKSDREVVEHLFAVTSSLDSMVLGETQIIGQVREAYDVAVTAQTAAASLNPLFQRAIAVGKQVMHETALAEGRLSVASVAVDYARNIFESFKDKTILSIGAGKMAALVLQGFAGLSPGRLLVCNRNPEKATELASRFNGQAVAFENLSDHLVAADVVMTSTGAAHPIITRNQFESLLRQRRYRPVFLIDIAVPRDIEASVGKLDNVYLYNLDDLQEVVSRTQAQRKDAIAAARAIVDRQVEDYAAWHRQRELGPAIHQLYNRYHRVAQEELARTLNKLPNISPAEKAHLEDLARRIVNKLLHDPVQVLRRSDSLHLPAGQYLHALEKLFQLGEAGQASEPDPNDPSADK